MNVLAELLISTSIFRRKVHKLGGFLFCFVFSSETTDFLLFCLCIFQSKIDEVLQLIQNSDPTGETQTDSTEMLRLENQCSRMAPLIDTELEKIDK